MSRGDPEFGSKRRDVWEDRERILAERHQLRACLLALLSEDLSAEARAAWDRAARKLIGERRER